MANDQLRILMFIFFAFLGTTLFISLKYHKFMVLSALKSFWNTSWVIKGFFILFLSASVTTFILYTNSPLNLPEINSNTRAEYKTTLMVEDGIVVAGNKNMRFFSEKENHHKQQAVGFVEKFSFDGELLWTRRMDGTNDDGEFKSPTTLNHIEKQEDGTLLVHGLKSRPISEKTYAEIHLKQDGTLLSKIHHTKTRDTIYSSPDINSLEIRFSPIDFANNYYKFRIDYSQERFGPTISKEIEVNVDYEDFSRPNRYVFDDVDLLYKDEEKIMIGLNLLNGDEFLGYNTIWVFDHQLNVIDTIDLATNMIPKQIIHHDNHYYLLSSNEFIGESFIGIIDEAYSLNRFKRLKSDERYFFAKQMHIESQSIYIAGNTFDRLIEGSFNREATGALFSLDFTLDNQTHYTIFDGKKINDFFFKEDTLYTVGYYNRFFTGGELNRHFRFTPALITYTNEKNHAYIFTISP